MYRAPVCETFLTASLILIVKHFANWLLINEETVNQGSCSTVDGKHRNAIWFPWNLIVTIVSLQSAVRVWKISGKLMFP